jgi:nucleoside-diphosphate-sugar epimerase
MILITGATGFIGKALTEYLCKIQKYNVRICVRKNPIDFPSDVDVVIVGDLSKSEFSPNIFSDVTCIIHLAGRAHKVNGNDAHALQKFRDVNVRGSLNLAKKASKHGVKRFIFLSSIGVNGNSSLTPFSEQDIPAPIQNYAISKFEAEQGLKEVSSTTGLELVIIRPPLVYGPCAPGNFATLIQWMNRNIPLPLGAIHNKRSFIAIDNLIDLILTCIEHPAAANQVFLVSDGEDLSTTELLSRLTLALGKKSRLFPINQQFLELSLKLINKYNLAQQLCGSLQVDISKAQNLLNWSPPIDVDEGLRKTAQFFLESESV